MSLRGHMDPPRTPHGPYALPPTDPLRTPTDPYEHRGPSNGPSSSCNDHYDTYGPLFHGPSYGPYSTERKS
eukprot:902964-Prymnesium_polylepis.1